MYKKKKFDKIFIKLAEQFMNENRYRLSGASFDRLQNDIFTTVYLRWEKDRLDQTFTFDIVSYNYPLIYAYDMQAIFNDNYRDEDDFSVSRISGKLFVADMNDDESIEKTIRDCFFLYLEYYSKFFDVRSISDYAKNYIEIDKIISKRTISLYTDSSRYEYSFLYILFYLNDYDECIIEVEGHIESEQAYLNEYFNIEGYDNVEDYIKEKCVQIMWLRDFKNALTTGNEDFLNREKEILLRSVENNKNYLSKIL